MLLPQRTVRGIDSSQSKTISDFDIIRNLKWEQDRPTRNGAGEIPDPHRIQRSLKAAKDDRERCSLLLLDGAGLRVVEMTQIKTEDIDFSKGYLHVQALNAKFKKPRIVVLLPKVAEALQKQLAGRSKGGLFNSYREGHISSRQVQNILDDIATQAGSCYPFDLVTITYCPLVQGQCMNLNPILAG